MYNRKTIEIVNAHKYLGLTLTPILVWTKACKTVSEQANKALSQSNHLLDDVIFQWVMHFIFLIEKLCLYLLMVVK